MDRVPLLVGVSGPLEGRRYRVTVEGLVLGRAPTCDVEIPDQGVSREHARVILHNAAVWVQDSGSRNGVYVNGKRITRHKQLSPGAKLVIGQHGFTLDLVAEDEAPPEPPPRSDLTPVTLDTATGAIDHSPTGTVDLDAPTGLTHVDLGSDGDAAPGGAGSSGATASGPPAEAGNAPEAGGPGVRMLVLVGVLGLALLGAAWALYSSG